MRKIIETEKGFIIAFDYNQNILNEVKLLPGREFNYQDKTWFVPKSSRTYVNQFAQRNKFQIGERKAIAPVTNMRIPEMPILERDIPLKMQLFGYQRQGVAYNLIHKKTILGDAPGLGKTAQAIATVIAAQAFPCLVICPSSLKINWEREFDMWGSHKATILSDSIKDTWDMLYQMRYADIFIVNYESLKKYFVADITQPIGKDGKKVPLRLNHIKFKSKINLFKSMIVDE